MKTATMAITLFSEQQRFPVVAYCEYCVRVESPPFCGKPAIGIFQSNDLEAHALCEEHAKEKFRAMLGGVA